MEATTEIRRRQEIHERKEGERCGMDARTHREPSGSFGVDGGAAARMSSTEQLQWRVRGDLSVAKLTAFPGCEGSTTKGLGQDGRACGGEQEIEDQGEESTPLRKNDVKNDDM